VSAAAGAPHPAPNNQENRDSASLEHPPLSPVAMDMDEDQGSVESQESSSVFHKKFDKMRKHLISPESEETERRIKAEKEEIMIDDDTNVSTQDNPVDERNEESQAFDDIPNKDLERLKIDDTKDRKTKSAVESHPQLLAHLNSTAPNLQMGFLKLPLQVSPKQATTSSSQVLLNIPKYSGKPSTVAKELPTLASQLNSAPLKSTSPFTRVVDQGNRRDNMHSETMSHLKDKLMRKYDSMENLDKIGPIQSQQVNENDKHPKISSASNPNIPAELYPPGMCSNNVSGVFPQSTLPIMHPAFLGSAGSGFVPRMFMMPGYNQHLAGMQQLAQIYAKNADQERR
jgi:hypothetical protein